MLIWDYIERNIFEEVIFYLHFLKHFSEGEGKGGEKTLLLIK